MIQIIGISSKNRQNRTNFNFGTSLNRRVIFAGERQSGVSAVATHVLAMMGALDIGAIGIDRSANKGLAENWKRTRPYVRGSNFHEPADWPSCVQFSRVSEALGNDWSTQTNTSGLAGHFQVIDFGRSWSGTNPLIATASILVFIVSNGADAHDRQEFLRKIREIRNRRDQAEFLVYSHTSMIRPTATRDALSRDYGVGSENIFVMPNWPMLDQAMRDGFLLWTCPVQRLDNAHQLAANAMFDIAARVIFTLGDSRRRPAEFFDELAARILRPTHTAGVAIDPSNHRDDHQSEGLTNSQRRKFVAGIRRYVALDQLPDSTIAEAVSANPRPPKRFGQRTTSKKIVTVRLGENEVAALAATLNKVPITQSDLLAVMVDRVERAHSAGVNLLARAAIPSSTPFQNHGKPSSFSLDSTLIDRLDAFAHQFFHGHHGSRSIAVRWIIRLYAALEEIPMPTMQFDHHTNHRSTAQ